MPLRIGFLLLFLISITAAQAQLDTGSFVHFGLKNGFPSNNVYSSIVDRNGYIWFATDYGVVKYNGYTVEVYNTDNGRLPANDVYELFEDNRGRIWIKNFGDKFGYLKNGMFKSIHYNIGGRIMRPQHFSEKGGLVYFLEYWKDKINVLVVDDDIIRQYSFNEFGHYTPDSSKMREFTLSNDFRINIWSDSLNVYKIDPTAPNNLKHIGQYPSEIRDAFSVGTYISPTGEFSRNSSSDNMFYHYNINTGFKKTINFEDLGAAPSERIYTYNPHSVKGNLSQTTSFFSNSHVYYLTPDFQLLSRQKFTDIAPTDRIVFRMQDPNGNMWYSTNGDGTWIKPTHYDLYANRQKNPALNTAKYLGTIGNSNFWWNKSDVSLYEVNGNQVVSKTKLHRDVVLKGVCGNDSVLYMCASDGVFIFDRKTQKREEIRKKFRVIGFPEQNISKDDSARKLALLYEPRIGTVMGNSLFLLVGNGILEEIMLGDSLTHFFFDFERFSGVFSDIPNKKVYFYSNNRIIVRDMASGTNEVLIDTLTKRQGIGSIKQLEKDKFGNTFILDDRSLMYFDETRKMIKRIPACFNVSNAIFHVNDNEIWVAGKFGIAFATIYSKDSISQFRIVPNIGTNAYTRINNFIVNSDGNTVLQTDIEYSFFPLDSIKKYSAGGNKMDGYFSLVLLRPSEKRISGNDTFKYRQAENVIRLDAINLYGKGSVKYEYRIDETKKWETSTSGEIFLATLKPGRYHKIECKVSDDAWQSGIYTFYIYRYPYWWQTRTWIIIFWASGVFLLLTVILLAILITRYYSRKREEKKRALTELELRAIHAQINPHFIFNTLSAALFFINKKRFDDAYVHVNKFSRLLRSYLKSSQNRFVLLGEELEMLRNYIELQQIRFEEKFEYEIDVDNKLPVNNLQIPSLLLQPLVENAINHGLFHSEMKGKLTLRFLQGENNEEMICIIEDTGIGRDAAKKINEESSTKESYGTKLTNKLLEIFKEYEHLNISLEYTDKAAPETGTIVTLTLKNLKYIA